MAQNDNGQSDKTPSKPEQKPETIKEGFVPPPPPKQKPPVRPKED